MLESLPKFRKELGQIVFNHLIYPPSPSSARFTPVVEDYGHNYHFEDIFCGYGKDMNQLLQLCGDGKSVVLDLGGGTGRLSQLLALQSKSVTLLDISDSMLEIARRKRQYLPAKFQARYQIEKGDAAQFALYSRFDYVFGLADAVAHLPSEAAILSCFKSVREHLAPEGVFVFDTHHRPYLENQRDWLSGIWNYISDVSIAGKKQRVWQQVRATESPNRFHLSHAVSRNLRRYVLASSVVFILHVGDWTNLLNRAGLHVLSVCGGWNSEPVNENSSYLRFFTRAI